MNKIFNYYLFQIAIPNLQTYVWLFSMEVMNLNIYIYDLLTNSSRTLEFVIGGMIFVNVVSFILSTEPSLADNPKASFVFDTIETCTVTVFTVEYLLR